MFSFLIKFNSHFYFIIIFTIVTSCTSKDKDYSIIFGDKYSEAKSFFSNNPWIADTIKKHGINPDIVISIVFPEVIRYSAIKDFAETKSLEVLYIQYGLRYADFSIGRFQIKPSFAYKLEKDWYLTMRNNVFSNSISHNDTLDNPSNRRLRINRLKDIYWQVKYLIMFYKLIEIKYNGEWESNNQKVLFLASAYNVGYWTGNHNIKTIGQKNYFHTGLIKPTSCYNFSDISLYYYLKIQMPN